MFKIDKNQICSQVYKLADTISHDYRGKHPILLCMMKGAMIFCADLMKAMTISVQLEIAMASSMTGTQSSGRVRLNMPSADVIRDRHVIIVEDIVDTGITINAAISNIIDKQPASLRICTLLDKTAKRQPSLKNMEIHYVGFMVPDLFLIGYGLDYNERFRELDCVREATIREIRMYAV
jgi:hypoxanthine phosphoribosyltransferase